MQNETTIFNFNKDLNSIQYLKNLCENYKTEFEPYLISLIPDILECLSEKTLYDETQNLINLLLEKINPCSFELISVHIFNAFESLKYQTKLGALKLLSIYTELNPKLISYNLPKIIESLISISSDVKKEVKEKPLVETKAAKKTTLKNIVKKALKK